MLSIHQALDEAVFLLVWESKGTHSCLWLNPRHLTKLRSWVCCSLWKGPVTLHLVIKGYSILALLRTSCIIFHISVYTDINTRSVSCQTRHINDSAAAVFMKTMYVSPKIASDSVDAFLYNFNSKSLNAVDAIFTWRCKSLVSRKYQGTGTSYL